MRSIVLGMLAGLAWGLPASGVVAAPVDASCMRPVFLTFDTGHMGVASWVGEVLAREGVRATFFIANEPTQTAGGGSLDAGWSGWWRERAVEGHLLASHTHDHVYWRADLPDGRFRVRASAGPLAGKDQVWTARQYCEELARPGLVLRQHAGVVDMAPLFRAPGGRTSPALLAAARACGYLHVGWSPAGFLGDELPSDRYPNELLLRQALRDVRPGDILMAHLGIWSRRTPWAPEVLEPLIRGLRAKGYCFATLRDHSAYQAHLAGSPPALSDKVRR